MSHCRLKSPRPGLLPDEENGKCGIVRCCAEFPSIGNHSPKRKRTQGGGDMRRHSQSKWKLEQNDEYQRSYGRDGCECSLMDCTPQSGQVVKLCSL